MVVTFPLCDFKTHENSIFPNLKLPLQRKIELIFWNIVFTLFKQDIISKLVKLVTD